MSHHRRHHHPRPHTDQQQHQSVYEETFQGVPVKELFPEEKSGWVGYCTISYQLQRPFNLTPAHRYVEWENAPERKRIASELLKTKKFTPIPGLSDIYW